MSFLLEKAWKDVRDADDATYEKGLLGHISWSEDIEAAVSLGSIVFLDLPCVQVG